MIGGCNLEIAERIDLIFLSMNVEQLLSRVRGCGFQDEPNFLENSMVL
jgi:hypothetical protein